MTAKNDRRGPDAGSRGVPSYFAARVQPLSSNLA